MNANNLLKPHSLGWGDLNSPEMEEEKVRRKR